MTAKVQIAREDAEKILESANAEEAHWQALWESCQDPACLVSAHTRATIAAKLETAIFTAHVLAVALAEGE